MYIVIKSWVGLYTALSIKFCGHPPKQQVPRSIHTHSTAQPSPSPPKFVLTINRKIFETSKKLLHSFVEM